MWPHDAEVWPKVKPATLTPSLLIGVTLRTPKDCTSHSVDWPLSCVDASLEWHRAVVGQSVGFSLGEF
jgi:hypothetical protein